MAGSAPPPVRRSERPPPREGGASSLLGTVVGGRYRIDSILGEGGMGTVYAAEHMLMRKRVALKVLHPAMSRLPEMVARFEREAMAAGHIDHPNIAAATDFGQIADGSFFLVLELVVGRSLRSEVSAGPFPTRRALHVATQIASALARAHSLGVVHRDLKPDNVMLVTRDGDADFVKVLDFGIAKGSVLDLGVPSATPEGEAQSAPPKVVTQVGMIYGTPEYMAPEQALGQPIDGRADLYAVGVLLFEMLTGKRPFDHDNAALLLGLQVTAPVPAIADVAPGIDVPPAVESVVRCLLAKAAENRFATALELEDALEQAAASLGDASAPRPPASTGLPTPASQTPEATASSEPQGPPKVRRGSAVVTGVAVAAVFVLGILVWHSAAPGPAPAPSGSAAPQSTAPTSASPAPSIAPNDPLAAVVIAGEAALAANDPDRAIRAVSPSATANPGRADLHRILEKAFARKKDRPSTLREAEAWLTADPSAQSDLILQADVGEVATQPAWSDGAITLLASRMGAAGVDILYDLAYVSRQAPAVSRRAHAALDQSDVRAHAGPAASILLDLRDAPSCEAKRALLPRVQSDADRRALSLLTPLASGRGPGACMRHDGALAEAIAAVRGRSRML